MYSRGRGRRQHVSEDQTPPPPPPLPPAPAPQPAGESAQMFAAGHGDVDLATTSADSTAHNATAADVSAFCVKS